MHRIKSAGAIAAGNGPVCQTEGPHDEERGEDKKEGGVVDEVIAQDIADIQGIGRSNAAFQGSSFVIERAFEPLLRPVRNCSVERIGDGGQKLTMDVWPFSLAVEHCGQRKFGVVVAKSPFVVKTVKGCRRYDKIRAGQQQQPGVGKSRQIDRKGALLWLMLNVHGRPCYREIVCAASRRFIQGRKETRGDEFEPVLVFVRHFILPRNVSWRLLKDVRQF